MKDTKLKETERQHLLSRARHTIERVVGGRSDASIDDSDAPELDAGAFVSLHKKGNLRGCIGTFDTTSPIVKQVEEMAVAAATRDPRFSPVSEGEIDDLDIEISVLTPARTVEDIDEIQVGSHGLIISRGFQKGVLLPQVATEYGWDRETFLSHTCRKAGLPEDAWKDPSTKIELFTAEVFGEEKGARS